jgi:hypothetical protein
MTSGNSHIQVLEMVVRIVSLLLVISLYEGCSAEGCEHSNGVERQFLLGRKERNKM